ncbi:MAG TPA: YXWGXW repeat-containing protein [Acidobacteriaceae bacterium]|nr:YXWGXW repeat-containing protein [Acidobacteriaceae bacterium]
MAFALSGCHSNQPQSQNQPAADPAAANLVPISSSTSGASTENPPPPPPDQTAQAPASSSASSDEYQSPPPSDENQSAPGQDQYASDYGESEADVAAQPPPPIPDYEQPPAPADDYVWTPGYWAYAPAGYYWVPGVWVMAPWIGALWTPGYWGFYAGQYHWYPGYWGPHIGFYGGVNYGCGYYGDGYEGGYWHGGHFFYNTAITRVNVTVIRNVYVFHVSHPFNDSRVSYAGGRGGLNFRPTAREVAARNEHHYAPLPAQRDLVRTAGQNRAQFAAVNHGHPQMVAQNRLTNEVRTAPAGRPEDVRGATPMPANRQAAGATRPTQSGTAPHRTTVTRNETRSTARPESNRTAPMERPEVRTQTQRPANRPTGGARPAPRVQPESRSQQRPQPRQQPQRQARPQPKPQAKPQPRDQGRPGDHRPTYT